MASGNENPYIQGCRYRWLLPSVGNSELTCQLASSYNFCVPLMQALVNRGFDSREKIDTFLFKACADDVGDPALLKDGLKAAERIKRALEQCEKILIVGDYDVDGITATALMMHGLLQQGATVNYFLPHRVRDGYGISERIIQKAVTSAYTLIITVDNGISAYAAAQKAHEAGIDLIIIDHHIPHESVPPAYAIVDPLQVDCQYPFKHLAGVGVAFKVLELLYKLLNKPLPQKVYELLLLGTIADVVPLIGENRYWVRKGLALVNENPSCAFKNLVFQAKLQKPAVSALDIAFLLTPQLNALGRLEDPRQGVGFLIGSNEREVERIGTILCELNQARKQIERVILAEIETAIAKGKIDLSCERVIIAASKQWPVGIVGLIASRLVAAYDRPALLLHIGSDGVARGSARSIPAFDIFQALGQSAHLLKHFGGHAGAAGLSIAVDNIVPLKEFLESRMRAVVSDEDLVAKIKIDVSISLSDVTGKLVDDLAYMEPFGSMNASLIFHVPSVTLLEEPRLLKDAHVKCRVFSEGVIKPVIFFNKPEFMNVFKKLGDQPFDLAVEIVENYWQGNRSIELRGIDVAYKGLA